jgi:glucosyl-3-phosphoglycerate phosphatase
MNPQDNAGNAGGGGNAPTILLIRHAVTALNQQGRLRSWSDVDIDPDKGRTDTLKTAQQLQHVPVSEIVHSDLTRAEQTSQILANQWFVPQTPDRNLRPWDLGEFTGMKFDDIKDDMNDYIKNPSRKVPGGEAFNTFLDRWQEGLGNLALRAQDSPTGVVAAVTHSRNIEATRYLLSGSKDTSDLAKANSVPPSGVMPLQFQNGKLTEVPYPNDHLSKDDK